MQKDKKIGIVEEQEKDEVIRFGLYIKESTLNLAKEHYAFDNCKSVSEFICKAIRFYSEFLALEDSSDVIPNIISATLKDISRESNNKQGRMLFKIAVELSILSNVIAAQQNLTDEDIERLRGACVTEVKKLNGALSFEDSVRWQS